MNVFMEIQMVKNNLIGVIEHEIVSYKVIKQFFFITSKRENVWLECFLYALIYHEKLKREIKIY